MKGRTSPFAGKKITSEIKKVKGVFAWPKNAKGQPVISGQLDTIAIAVMGAKGKKVETVLGQEITVVGKEGDKVVKINSAHLATLVDRGIIALA